MNSKQAKTLAAIFQTPTLGSIVWGDIERLLMAIGCTRIEGKGSGVKFRKAGLVLNVHRPHPNKEAKFYQVEITREFLIALGVAP